MASDPAGAADNPPTYTEATSNPAGAVGGYTQPAGPSAAGYSSPPAGYGTQGYGNPPVPAYKQDSYNDYPGGYQGGAAPGVYSAPPGYQPVVQQPYAPNTIIAVQQPPAVVVVGGCPACRVGVLEDDFTVLGVCCAILFFPLGILCCLAMRQRHCPNCGAVFS